MPDLTKHFFRRHFVLKIFKLFVIFYFKIDSITLDPEPDPNRAKILDPDPNSMYLDPQHCSWLTTSAVGRVRTVAERLLLLLHTTTKARASPRDGSAAAASRSKWTGRLRWGGPGVWRALFCSAPAGRGVEWLLLKQQQFTMWNTDYINMIDSKHIPQWNILGHFNTLFSIKYKFSKNNR